MKLRAFVLGLSLVATPLAAHDFWLQPLRFQTEVGKPLPITFQLGHGQFRQRWEGADRVLLIDDLLPHSRQHLKSLVMTNNAQADLVPTFQAPGLHVVAMQTSFAKSDLPAIRYNDYIKAEGLALPIAKRNHDGTTATDGRERYSRRAKTYIQVGKQTPANTALATRALGLKLEIVPDRNPYDLGPDRMLPVHVMYKGHRLANATVMLTSLEFDSRPVATVVTDKAGRASFRVPPVGEWLVNVLWSEPVTGDPTADFDTTFSSLTFGYAASMPRR